MVAAKSSGFLCADFMKCVFLLCCVGLIQPEETAAVHAEETTAEIPSLFKEGRSYALHDPIVSTSVYCGTALSEQTDGPWTPMEGPKQQAGTTQRWKGQIKQMMAANIDVICIIADPKDERQILLLQALNELRAKGYDVPKVAPFFDPLFLPGEQGGRKYDLATQMDKDELVSRSLWFLNQYFSTNTDPFSQSYLARIDDRIALNTGPIFLDALNDRALSRKDIEEHLMATYGQKHPYLQNGIYLIAKSVDKPNSFADERDMPFDVNAYYIEKHYKSIIAAQIKPGYWDRNVSTLGGFLARDGGKNYRKAWASVESNPNLNRVYIESWNNYDEGSEICASKSSELFNRIDSENPIQDLWSDSHDPYEYIKTTASGARRFNNTPDYAARILWHNFPKKMKAGEKKEIIVVMRNEGDVAWTNKGVFLFGQCVDRLAGTHFSAPTFSAKTHLWTKPTVIPDNENNVGLYGGIFRGSPVTMRFQIKAPIKKGGHDTVWSMLRYGESFGDKLKLRFHVN